MPYRFIRSQHEDWRAFQALLPELLADHEGNYAVMHDAKVVGIYSRQRDALSTAILEFGAEPFLVLRIERNPRLDS